MLFHIAKKSLLSRKTSVLLTIVAVSISIFVFVSVELLKQQTRSNFTRAVSGVDLIVGPKTGSSNLLLSSIYRIGNVNASVDNKTREWLESQKFVDWVIPISLGDSHRGYRVMGTVLDYFSTYKFGAKQSIVFASGTVWKHSNNVVIGAEVARKLSYKLGDSFTLSHGTGVTSFTHHDGFPVTIIGILEKTGTAIDQTIHISLAGLAEAHGESSVKVEALNSNKSASELEGEHNTHRHDDHETVTSNMHSHVHETSNQGDNTSVYSAFLVGAKAKFATLMLQQKISNYSGAPIMAIIPGVALTELWQLLGQLEALLSIVAALVLLAALFGLATMLLATMKERHLELALFRTLGASPRQIFLMIELEVALISISSIILSGIGLAITLVTASGWLANEYSLYLQVNDAVPTLVKTAIIVLSSALVVGFLPAFYAYRDAKTLSVS